MAQLVAHLHGMQGVRGSSPLSSTFHLSQMIKVCAPGSEEVVFAQDLLNRMDEALQEGSGVALDSKGRSIDEACARSACRIIARVNVANLTSM